MPRRCSVAAAMSEPDGALWRSHSPESRARGHEAMPVVRALRGAQPNAVRRSGLWGCISWVTAFPAGQVSLAPELAKWAEWRDLVVMSFRWPPGVKPDLSTRNAPR